MFTLPSWLQPLLLIIATGAIAWAVVNAQSVTRQQSTITELRAQTSEEAQRFANEKQQMQTQLEQQQRTLNELSEKQLMLQSLVDALPSSLVETINDTTEPSTPSSIKKPATEQQDVLTTTEKVSSGHLPEKVDVSQHNQASNFTKQAQQLLASQQQFLSFISGSIQNRAATLTNSLAEVGIAPKYNSQLAQGGPYHQLELEQLPPDYLKAIDNLVALNNLEQVLTTLPDSMPVAKEDYYVSSQFGFRKDPITGRRAYHKGVDLAGWHKTEILAPAAGTVVKAGRNGGYGKFIEIKHEHGLVSRFGHLHTIKVKKGQQIKKSEVIALMGSTGRSTSTHLHYEVLQNGKHINPIKLTKVVNRVQ
ncbi:membrane protein [Pseudoalteromonas sp. A25]|uniref:M23 family metallopeptidase n=1 Tax=Pseudoalteromonas sp. A25 TaxID=116092 RepID=UPI0012A11A9B|nr:M23 family metallopeptidase [Pseudoalteromonas sp. A25]BBN80840.1 membrane protein [Pseudoalteromonas sp. A25]